MMAMMLSVTMKGTKSRGAAGNRGRLNRTKPYAPIFRRIPARMTEPAVGASVCASGSHVWKGNIGTLMAKERKKASQTRFWKDQKLEDHGYESLISSRTSKVYFPATFPAWK